VAAALCAAAALVVWLVALSASWVAGCPQSSAVSGFDGGVSAWPPGAHCLRDAADSGPFVYEALPWAEVAVVALLALALIVLVAAVLVSVRGVRLRDDRLPTRRARRLPLGYREDPVSGRLSRPSLPEGPLGAGADQQAELARLGDQGAVGRPELAVLLEEPVTDEPRAKAA
jgi:hypothetical protein